MSESGRKRGTTVKGWSERDRWVLSHSAQDFVLDRIGGIPRESTSAFGLAKLASLLFGSLGFDVGVARVREEQIYFQIFDDLSLLSLQDFESLWRGLIACAGDNIWIVRETKHIKRGHAYTEYVLERNDSLRAGIVPYALSEEHGRLREELSHF